MPSQQLVEQHPQRVDVARRGHRLGAGSAPGWRNATSSALAPARSVDGDCAVGPNRRAAWRCRSRAAWARRRAVIRMLPGLRSRWMTRFWCANCTAAHTLRNSVKRALADRQLPVGFGSSGRSGLALDILHHEVGQPVLRCAAVEQPGRCEDAGAAPESGARSRNRCAPADVVGVEAAADQLQAPPAARSRLALGQVHRCPCRHGRAAAPAEYGPIRRPMPSDLRRGWRTPAPPGQPAVDLRSPSSASTSRRSGVILPALVGPDTPPARSAECSSACVQAPRDIRRLRSTESRGRRPLVLG